MQGGQSRDNTAIGSQFRPDKHLFIGIKLVPDLAHQLFQDALQGEDALRSAEFIDDQGHVHAVGKELGQGGLQGLLAVDPDHVALDSPQVEVLQGSLVTEDVLDVNQAQTAVQVPVAEREAGVAAFLGHVQVVLQGEVEIEVLDLIAREQNVRHDQLPHHEGILQNKLGHGGHFRGLLAQQLDLGLQVEGIQVGDRILPPEAPEQPHHARHQPVQGTDKPPQDPDGQCPHPQTVERVSQPQGAGNQLTEQLVQANRQKEGKDSGNRGGGAVEGQLHRAGQVLKQRVAEESIEDQAHGHPEPDNANGAVPGGDQGTGPLMRFNLIPQVGVEVAEADLDEAELAGYQESMQHQGQGYPHDGVSNCGVHCCQCVHVGGKSVT